MFLLAGSGAREAVDAMETGDFPVEAGILFASTGDGIFSFCSLQSDGALCLSAASEDLRWGREEATVADVDSRKEGAASPSLDWGIVSPEVDSGKGVSPNVCWGQEGTTFTDEG